MSNTKLYTALAVLLSLGIVGCQAPQPPETPQVDEAAQKAAQDAEDARRRAEEEAARRRAEEEARRRAEEERRRAEEEARRRAEAEARAAMVRAAEAALQDVNFAYDKADIRATDRAKLQAIAEFMNAFPQASVLIEGHCDERGTIEYNMALGERRAAAARSYLVNLGVSASRFSTVSFGKERPKVFGSDERSWLVNRRCEFKLQ